MKKLKLYLAAAIVFMALVGLAMALVPPPPVNQNLGINDVAIDHASTNATDQSACRQCHQTTGTNITEGYNNTAGTVPVRHHSLAQRAVINPLTGTKFVCQDCHPSTPGQGMGILLDRSCVNCHNGTAFNTSGARVGNFSRPHHVNTSYTSVVGFGNPAADRHCDVCHGSFVANYDDGHYKPTYATDFMITPYANFKVNSDVPNPNHEGNKTWGGCESCHEAHVDDPDVDNLHDSHHVSILGFGTGFQTIDTPFNLAGGSPGNNRTCFVCHVVTWTATSASPYRFYMTNPFTGLPVTNASNASQPVRLMELRNTTIEAAGAVEFASPNGDITFNGTGCQKCHSVQSLHNIQFDYVQNGPAGYGHINNDSDCSGCHNSWVPATDFVPGALIPTVNSVEPTLIAENTASTLTISGLNFVNDVYTSVVTVDGTTYEPTTITDTQITVNIPALSAGTHQVQLVKDGTVLSKLSTLTVISMVTVSSATLDGQTLTLVGTGFGSQPENAEQNVLVGSAGYSASIIGWTDTQIVATVSGTVNEGDLATVVTASGGQAAGIVVVSAPTPDSVTVTAANGGENWQRGTTQTITWAHAGSSEAATVKIELLKGTSVNRVIASSTENGGTYSWTIPGNQAPGTNYKIRITSVDHTPSYTDSSDANFQISK